VKAGNIDEKKAKGYCKVCKASLFYPFFILKHVTKINVELILVITIIDSHHLLALKYESFFFFAFKTFFSLNEKVKLRKIIMHIICSRTG